jgi:hypothetical protein
VEGCTMICIARGKKPRDFTRLTQHFFFFTKRKPVLKEKQGFFGKAFLSKKKFLVEICVILWLATNIMIL